MQSPSCNEYRAFTLIYSSLSIHYHASAITQSQSSIHYRSITIIHPLPCINCHANTIILSLPRRHYHPSTIMHSLPCFHCPPFTITQSTSYLQITQFLSSIYIYASSFPYLSWLPCALITIKHSLSYYHPLTMDHLPFRQSYRIDYHSFTFMQSQPSKHYQTSTIMQTLASIHYPSCNHYYARNIMHWL